MKNSKRFVQTAILLSLFAGAAMNAAAQVTISSGYAMSTMEAKTPLGDLDGDMGYGANIYFDYLLPIGVPVSLGFEGGYDTASLNDNGIEIMGAAIPLLLRAAYHFDFAANLDLYLVGKVGYVLGFAEYDNENNDGYDGIGFGFDLGVAYYLGSRFGFFIEAGFDRYNAEKSFDDYKVEVPFTRYVTLGISTKF